MRTAARLVTSCTAGAGVELPAAMAGERVRVLNRGAAACTVYSPNGGGIESSAVNAAVTVAAGMDATYELFSATQGYQ